MMKLKGRPAATVPTAFVRRGDRTEDATRGAGPKVRGPRKSRAARSAAAWLLAACALMLATPAAADPAGDRTAILGVVAAMEGAWNRGDFAGYMAGFKKPDVVFVSGGRFQDGWQGTLDHYRRDYGASAATRGTLHFYDMRVDLLAPDAAMLVGRYHLERPDHAAEGINTRLFRKIGGRWLITLNHVSAHDVSAAPAGVSAVPSAPADR